MQFTIFNVRSDLSDAKRKYTRKIHHSNATTHRNYSVISISLEGKNKLSLIPGTFVYFIFWSWQNVSGLSSTPPKANFPPHRLASSENYFYSFWCFAKLGNICEIVTFSICYTLRICCSIYSFGQKFLIKAENFVRLTF